ncbi:MAG: hypothetical protein HFG60_01385 [Lachnospiraceae bacterium]|nr:hypothetical protein [Lachnospiraceae bacterium]MCI9183661.1 hypothetical protein [Lachnospiraceae bacterium]
MEKWSSCETGMGFTVLRLFHFYFDSQGCVVYCKRLQNYGKRYCIIEANGV